MAKDKAAKQQKKKHRQRSEQQELKIQTERDVEVYKRNDMLQKGRHELSLQEQRCVLYAISKIKPDDSAFQEYTFQLADFYKICGIQNESYTELKAVLQGLADRSWWITIDDAGTESLVRWFSTLHTNKGSGTVKIKFHEDMMPFLLELTKDNQYYTHYALKYVLAMKSQYAIRLYELLKSYQLNNYEWFFEVDHLKKLLNCENYDNFAFFRRRVLEPAVDEINKYTDIKIAWEGVKEGRRIARVNFYMVKKKKDALLEASQAIADELDGQIDLSTLIDNTQSNQSNIRNQFFAENIWSKE